MINSARKREGQAADPRLARYVAADLSGVSVRRAVTDADWAVVASLRARGFSRVWSAGANLRETTDDWVDATDRQPGAFSLIGYSSAGQPLATLRVQDGRICPLELGDRINLAGLLHDRELPCAQIARLTAAKAAGSVDVMFGMFKAVWRWCLAVELRTIVIATPAWSRPIYEFMFFTDRGATGRFRHELAGGAEHATMTLSVSNAESIWRSGDHPLSTQFFDIEHDDLRV